MEGWWTKPQLLFFFPFWPHGMELPQPGIEPLPPTVEAQSLNHWTTRDVPKPWLSQNYGINSYVFNIFHALRWQLFWISGSSHQPVFAVTSPRQNKSCSSVKASSSIPSFSGWWTKSSNWNFPLIKEISICMYVQTHTNIQLSIQEICYVYMLRLLTKNSLDSLLINSYVIKL